MKAYWFGILRSAEKILTGCRFFSQLRDDLDRTAAAMTTDIFSFRLEQPADAPTIEALQATLFGPERFKRAAYVLRNGVPPDPTLSFVALAGERLPAPRRMTP